MQAWPGLGRRSANPSQNPISPSHIGQWEIRRHPHLQFHQFSWPQPPRRGMRQSIANANLAHVVSAVQAKARNGADPRNPMHLPRGLQVSVIPGNRC